MTGPDRLRAALRRLRRPRPERQRGPEWGSDEWCLSVEQRIAALEARSRNDRIVIVVGLAAAGALERLAAAGVLERVLDVLP